MTADGQYVEVVPDSMETDSVRKSGPVFKSAGGRTLYGGGAITPDVIVSGDTISSKEQTLARALAPQAQKYLTTLYAFADEQKGKVKSDFTVNPEWKEELYRRLVADTVKIDKAVYDAGASYVERDLELRVARVAFGDTATRRHSLKDDSQLRRAMDLIRKGMTQKEIFAAAALEPQSRPATSRRGQ